MPFAFLLPSVVEAMFPSVVEAILHVWAQNPHIRWKKPWIHEGDMDLKLYTSIVYLWTSSIWKKKPL